MNRGQNSSSSLKGECCCRDATIRVQKCLFGGCRIKDENPSKEKKREKQSTRKGPSRGPPFLNTAGKTG